MNLRNTKDQGQICKKLEFLRRPPPPNFQRDKYATVML